MLPTETQTNWNQRGAIMCALVITVHEKETQTDRHTDRQTDRQISDYLKNLFYISEGLKLVDSTVNGCLPGN